MLRLNAEEGEVLQARCAGRLEVEWLPEPVDGHDVEASDAVERLRAAGVVRQVNIGKRNRAFEAVGLFEAFTGFERALASPDADTNISLPVRAVPTRSQ